MPDSPAVQEAREELVKLVPKAVETLGRLMHSDQDSVRLGASKEVLDRGGLPAKSTQHVEVEIGMDAEIEKLLRGIKRQRVAADTADEMNIEDAIVIEDQPELLGEVVVEERAASHAPLDLTPEPEPEDEDNAWWQASPPEPPC